MRNLRIAVLAILLAGSYFAGRMQSRHQNADASDRAVLYYTDPMHPSYKSDKPGTAPDCGMKLEPVYSPDSSPPRNGDRSEMEPPMFHVTPEQQRSIGLRSVAAEGTEGRVFMISTIGRIEAEEGRIYPLTAKAEGWIRKIHPSSTGSLVRRGQPLVEVYGREYRVAQQSFLVSLNAVRRMAQRNDSSESAEQAKLTLTESLLTLRAMGLGEQQIDNLRRTGQIQTNVELTSPVDGWIIFRNVFPDQKIVSGMELFRIVDLRRVWVRANLDEDRALLLRKGAVSRFSVRQYPGRSFEARFTATPSLFDSQSHVFVARLEADNADFALRPEMVADVKIPVALRAAVVVPVDSVIIAVSGRPCSLPRAVGISNSGVWKPAANLATWWKSAPGFNRASGSL